MTPQLKDIRPDGDTWQISLTKLTGLKIKDITGYITTEFGDPCFQLVGLVFEDGAEMGFEGEHDLPYLTSDPKHPVPNMDNETLQHLSDTETDEYEKDWKGEG